MLACDLIMDVRASHSITSEQISRLERMVFAEGEPNRDQLDLLFLIDTYLERRNPGWAELLVKATLAAAPAASLPGLAVEAPHRP